MSIEIKDIDRIIEKSWYDTFGISGKEVIELIDKIDDIFHKVGYTVPHYKIERFVVECIKIGK